MGIWQENNLENKLRKVTLKTENKKDNHSFLMHIYF